MAKARTPIREKRARSPRTTKQLERAVQAADDKKAGTLAVLDLRKASGFADFFIICSGGNTRHNRAIADGILAALSADGAEPAHIEGYDRSEWILLDYFDFIVHIFSPQMREFYGLERLWGNAERMDMSAVLERRATS
jgi:ribosome-associated protein